MVDPAHDRGAEVAVIGAGMAGLAAAHRLARLGHRPTVFESGDRVGGRVCTERGPDRVFDTGAFIYLGSYAESRRLMDEIGLGEQLVRVDAYGAMPRDGRLHYLDLRTPVRSLLRTRYLSTRSKLKALRLVALLARHWRDLNYRDASGLAAVDRETVDSYFRRELGDELADYLGSVVIRGPWLADPETASLAQLLWTMKNFFKPYFYGLPDGMAALPEAIAAPLDVWLGQRVNSVEDTGRGVRVTVDAAGGPTGADFDACVIATTADQALAMYPQLTGAARTLYENTEYISSVNTHLVLRRRPDVPATYILASPREHPDLCGVIVDHLKAPGRVTADKGMLTVFCRHEWCEKHLDAPDEVILAQVLVFVRPYYGDLTDDVVDYRIGRWPRVVPKMPAGRYREVIAYEQTLDRPARVQLAGDLDPIGGVNAALVSGTQAAERVARTVRSA